VSTPKWFDVPGAEDTFVQAWGGEEDGQWIIEYVGPAEEIVRLGICTADMLQARSDEKRGRNGRRVDAEGDRFRRSRWPVVRNGQHVYRHKLVLYKSREKAMVLLGVSPALQSAEKAWRESAHERAMEATTYTVDRIRGAADALPGTCEPAVTVIQAAHRFKVAPRDPRLAAFIAGWDSLPEHRKAMAHDLVMISTTGELSGEAS
jgi:hypothetical protein